MGTTSFGKIWDDDLKMGRKMKALQRRMGRSYDLDAAVFFLAVQKILDPAGERDFFYGRDEFAGAPANVLALEDLQDCYDLLEDDENRLFDHSW